MRVCLGLGKSPALGLLALLLHGGALLSLWLVALPGWLRWGLLVAVVLSWWRMRGLHVRRDSPAAVTGILCQNSQWSLRRADGGEVSVRPDPRLLFWHPRLTLMGFRPAQGGRPRWVVIARDACDREEFRRLRALLTRLLLADGKD